MWKFNEPKCCSVFDREVKFFGEGVTIWKIITFVVAEFMGTAMLVFWGCMFINASDDHFRDLLTICLSFGMIIASILQMFSHISHALLNPALVVGACVLGALNIPLSLVYMAAEFLGAIAGYGILLLLTPASIKVNHCCTEVNLELNLGQAFGVEFILTFFLILVLCGCWDERNIGKHDSIPLKFGFAITALALAGAKYTGAGMNPARSLAPAIYEGMWEHHWVYWVGPFSGGFVAALLYRLIFGRKASNPSAEEA